MVVQAILKVRHEGCVSERTANGSKITHLGGDLKHCVALFKAESSAGLKELLHATGYIGEPCKIIDEGDGWALAHCDCHKVGTQLEEIFHDLDCIPLWPAIESDGHEYYTILAPSQSQFKKLCKRLSLEGQVTIERQDDVIGPALNVAISSSHLTSNLTPRQLDTLNMAILTGYYDSPRRIYTGELAELLKISRSTCQEHLRKAEATVMRAFGALLNDHPVLSGMALKRRGRPKRKT